MAAKLKVDQLETVDGTGNVTLNNSVTMASGKTLPAASLTGSLPTGMGGKVLQVVSATQTSSTTTTSSSFVDTGLTATITPTSSSSTILIFSTLSLFVTSTGGDTRIGGKLLRDSTSVFETSYIIRSNTGGHDKRIYAVNLEDSPATTSATVYKMQFKRSLGSDTIYMGINSEPSSMILMEIAG